MELDKPFGVRDDSPKAKIQVFNHIEQVNNNMSYKMSIASGSTKLFRISSNKHYRDKQVLQKIIKQCLFLFFQNLVPECLG